MVALDLQRSMMRKLATAIDGSGNAGNVSPILGDATALPFTSETFDVVFMVTALPEVPDPHCALVEARRVLKPGGKLAVTELFLDPDYPLRSTTIEWGKDAGFELEGSFGNFFNYTMRFHK